MAQCGKQAKVYGSENRLTVVAPMAGLKAEDFRVSLTGELLTIETIAEAPERIEQRVALPRSVDVSLATAVYAYGVLVVAMPLTNPGAPVGALGPGLVTNANGTAGRVEPTSQAI